MDVAALDSTIVIDLKYASSNNFLGKPVYPISRCLLRKSVAQRLIRVQRNLQQKGLGLKIWDGYRPLSVQREMWELVPDPRYVADPEKGSRHNRASAVDVTLVDSLGYELEMPTLFDDFSEKASRDYEKASAEALENRRVLEEAMVAEGFIPLPTEWWHFDDPDWERFPILDIPLDEIVID